MIRVSFGCPSVILRLCRWNWYQVIGTKYVVLGTKYLMLGTKYLVLGSKYLVLGIKYLVLGCRERIYIYIYIYIWLISFNVNVEAYILLSLRLSFGYAGRTANAFRDLLTWFVFPAVILRLSFGYAVKTDIPWFSLFSTLPCYPSVMQVNLLNVRRVNGCLTWLTWQS